ncbi:hypothetical protein [Acinetobacter phage Ab69]|nr:hypothetical protein [Acinetobacter phage Ab69]
MLILGATKHQGLSFITVPHIHINKEYARSYSFPSIPIKLSISQN